MTNMNQTELQNLKKLVILQETMYEKANAYSAQAVDPQIKQVFTKYAQDRLNTKQKLITFLKD